MGFGQTDCVAALPLSYWRSTSGFEVDFIVGDHTAVEVKAKENVAPHDLKPMLVLAEEKKLKRYLLVSLEPRPRKVESVTILPYNQFLEAFEVAYTVNKDPCGMGDPKTRSSFNDGNRWCGYEREFFQ